MVGLRKEIEGGEGLNGVSGSEEFLQVARERGGIAGDVGDLCGVEIQEAFDHR